MAHYADLEIRIFERQPEGFPVELTLNHEQQFGPAHLDLSVLPWQTSGSPQEDGEILYRWLFADSVLREAWARVQGQARRRSVRLRIDAAEPEVHALPWELLRDPDDPAGPAHVAADRATPFSRYLAGTWQPGYPVLNRPIRILVAVANPALDRYPDYPALDVEREWALLQEATEGLEAELVLLEQPCTLAALEAALADGYHVLHIIAHGAARKGKNVLLLANDDNEVALARDEEVAAMLARQIGVTGEDADRQLRLLFLASCQSATRSPADAFRGLAPRLVAAGVPVVLAMQDLVTVESAQRFARTFYEQLLQHGQVDLATNEARARLLTAGMVDAGVPVLFSRLRGNQLLGQRGEVSSGDVENFWTFLLGNIADGRCTPFLGPGVTEGLLPTPSQLAERLALLHKYPLPDRHRLSRVAQYASAYDKDRLVTDYYRLLQAGLFRYLEVPAEQRAALARATFSETATTLGWAEWAQAHVESEVHHVLAQLKLPLYITTNGDNFMIEALKQVHPEMEPRRLGLRWDQPVDGPSKFALDTAPTPERPVVFHLDGYDAPDQIENLVLSEDDFLAHFVRLSRDQDLVLPADVPEILAESSFLFLGYSLDDWEFRLILHGLLPSITQQRRRKQHVGVQLDVQDLDEAKRVKAYLEKYLEEFEIDIYWGAPQQFVNELQARYREHKALYDLYRIG